jgi:hypothetical protein
VPAVARFIATFGDKVHPMILAISDAEKLSTLDLPIALLMLAFGVVAISLRKQQAAARLVRVKKGELSEAEAKKNEKIIYWSGYVLTALGLLLLGLWATGR